MGFMRKALFVATAGLSGRVFKDDSKKHSTAKADAKQARPQRKKVTRAKPQARRKRQARPEPQARRKPQARPKRQPQPTPQAARTATATATARPVAGSGDGTTGELERLADLHGRGALTNQEFAAAKAKILGTGQAPQEPRTDSATFPAVEANVAAARHLADLAARDDASVTTLSSD